jgi:hypothetical protein
MIYVPPMRGAMTMPPEGGLASMSFELTGNDGARDGGNRFETNHFEGQLNLSYTLTEVVEFHSTLSAELLTGDVELTWRGQPMVETDRGERMRLSNLVLGTKFNLLPLGRGAPDIWAALDFKIQGTDKELADSGRPGLAFSFLVSQRLGPIWGHLNMGWALSDGQKAFPPVVDSGTGQADYIPVDRIFFWGLSFVWPLTKAFAVSLQGTGHTNGFKELSILNKDVHVISAGVRGLYKKVYAELVLGGGASETSLDYFVRLEIGYIF